MSGVVLRALHLCSGYGGFELGLRMAGVPVRTVAHAERDAHAAAVLVARMEDKALDPAPIWDDLCTFDGRRWRGHVDIITAGFPCQPFSAAGRKQGVSDDRWLWPEIARIIREVGPRYVFLENVRGVVKHGLGFVLRDLADLGFDAEWGLLSASEVGAPHKRERWWLLARAVAHADSPGLVTLGREPEHDGHARHDADGQGGPHVAHPSDARGVQGLGSSEGGRCFPGPPHPDDDAGWDEWRERGGPEPGVRRELDGATGRMERRDPQLADRLHLLGNGLVPQAAAAAFIELLSRLEGPQP